MSETSQSNFEIDHNWNSYTHIFPICSSDTYVVVRKVT